jgi:hypothetical protein
MQSELLSVYCTQVLQVIITCVSQAAAMASTLAHTIMNECCLLSQARSGGRGELQEARTLMTQLKTERDALRAQLDVIQVCHTI